MCTSVSFLAGDHYFGRNLDLSYSYDERVVITPRNYPLAFRRMPTLRAHYALIGMATVADGYPLYYEATNEAGLSMAGLNFPGNADYKPEAPALDNVTPFEFIPWILGQCASVAQARALLGRINLVNIPFSPALPLSPLHWMIADRDASIVVESVADGLRVYDNPVGVLTNNPPFDKQLFALNNYMHLTAEAPVNRFSPTLDLAPYCLGMGSLGLPGDPSSMSRFVRAAFTLKNSVCGDTEAQRVSQFFHILGAVCQQRGVSHVKADEYEYTLYSCCCNASTGVYFYITYDNSRITAVDMRRENLDASALIVYPLVTQPQILMQN